MTSTTGSLKKEFQQQLASTVSINLVYLLLFFLGVRVSKFESKYRYHVIPLESEKVAKR